jgi:hypothetical protein
LPTKPIDRKAIARIPARIPGPRIVTSSRAQMSELIDRDATMSSNAIGRTTSALGVVLRAARNASGSAGTMPSAVPSVAMLNVSHNGRQRRGR